MAAGAVIPDGTRIVLIRHGEAQCYVDQTVGGPKGYTGLSERERVQAAALRDRLVESGELRADVLYASTLPRARETAQIVAPAFGEAVGPARCQDDLCELHPGEADALTWDEYRARYQADGWDPYRPMAPGGESWAEFMVRVGRALTTLAVRHAGQTVVVACHGGVIEGSLSALGGLSPTHRFDVEIENTSITEWHLRPSRWGDERWALVRFNDAAHVRP